ncbi:MAG: hypothetical protein GY765_03040 [bacterium]|nr:hypothetical protein [bacterium]
MKKQKLEGLSLNLETITNLNRDELCHIKGRLMAPAESAARCTNPAYCDENVAALDDRK